MQDKTQMTMLVTWMIELFLNQLGGLKEQGQDDTSEYDNTQEQFRKFLSQQRVRVSVIEIESIGFESFATGPNSLHERLSLNFIILN